MIIRKRNAFTLIELLIVVAIIAILAAIAVPNFLEAQTRAKVARVKADIRTIATAIESYAVDNNRGPVGTLEVQPFSLGTRWGFTNPGANWAPKSTGRRWAMLTTPIAYLTSVPLDPFVDQTAALSILKLFPAMNPNDFWLDGARTYSYQYYDFKNPGGQAAHPDISEEQGHKWSLSSPGPHRVTWAPGYSVLNVCQGNINQLYDPTNGTISTGFIVRTTKGNLN
jgi:prepilin-type N-terminal cleavage/methylation domain-containing protein